MRGLVAEALSATGGPRCPLDCHLCMCSLHHFCKCQQQISETLRTLIWMHPCGGFSCFSIYSFPKQKLPFLAKLSVKQGRPPRGKTACGTHVSICQHFLGFTLLIFLYNLFFWIGSLPLPLLPHCPDADFQPWCQIFRHKLAVAAFVLIRNVFSREACFWVWDREGETQHVTVSRASATHGKMRQITNSNPRGSSREAFADHPNESVSQDVLR